MIETSREKDTYISPEPLIYIQSRESGKAATCPSSPRQALYILHNKIYLSPFNRIAKPIFHFFILWKFYACIQCILTIFLIFWNTPRKEGRQTYQLPFASSELSSLVFLFLCFLCNYARLLQNFHMGSLGMGSWLEIFCDKIRDSFLGPPRNCVFLLAWVCVFVHTNGHINICILVFMDTYILFNSLTCQLPSIDKSPDIPFYFEATGLTQKSSGQAPLHNETLPKKATKKNLLFDIQYHIPSFPRELKFTLVI